MNVKRETSLTVSDLQISSSEPVKRIAVTPSSMFNQQTDVRFRSILSEASDNFTQKYEIGAEVGKGGFSMVYQCRKIATGEIFAVKIVDLRPLRLRERFNPSRLRREVDIMKRLCHPNIIRFIDVFETPDRLLMVMEYCPGRELFDVILSQTYLSEDIARPIFAQICKALFYLHSLNIIHRDIKPENVLILNQPDPTTGLPVVKLLDFGLSKNAGAGSAAKTFVGTPCYLAPEVEYVSRGLGGTYGLPADCWSLGAVLYVSLVARFPEFEHDRQGEILLKLPPALWDGVSSQAKDLIRGLMTTDPSRRITVAQACHHPWLQQYRCSLSELREVEEACRGMSAVLLKDELEAERAFALAEGRAIPSLPTSLFPPNPPSSLPRHQSPPSATSQALSIPPRSPPTPPLEATLTLTFTSTLGSNSTPIDLPSNQNNEGICEEDVVVDGHERKEGRTEGERSLSRSGQDSTLSWRTGGWAWADSESLKGGPQKGNPPPSHAGQRSAGLGGLDHRLAGDQVESAIVIRSANQIPVPGGPAIGVAPGLGAGGGIGLGFDYSQNLVPNNNNLHVVGWEGPGMVGMGGGPGPGTAGGTPGIGSNASHLQLNSLMLLQKSISNCFDNVDAVFTRELAALSDDAHVEGPSGPDNSRSSALILSPGLLEVASQVREGASLSRQQQLQSYKMLRNIEQTATAILHLFPDLELAVEEGEPHLAINFFSMMKGWVAELRESVAHTRSSNTQSLHQVQRVIERCTEGIERTRQEQLLARKERDREQELLLERQREKEHRQVVLRSILDKIQSKHNTPSGSSSGPDTFSTEEVLDLFLNLFGTDVESLYSSLPSQGTASASSSGPDSGSDQSSFSGDMSLVTSDDRSSNSEKTTAIAHPTFSEATSHLVDALGKLREVDIILDKLTYFWTNTELTLDALTKTGQHVEQFISARSTPRLMARFRERTEEYKRFWQGVAFLCSQYLNMGGMASGGPGGVAGGGGGGPMSKPSSPSNLLNHKTFPSPANPPSPTSLSPLSTFSSISMSSLQPTRPPTPPSSSLLMSAEQQAWEREKLRTTSSQFVPSIDSNFPLPSLPSQSYTSSHTPSPVPSFFPSSSTQPNPTWTPDRAYPPSSSSSFPSPSTTFSQSQDVDLNSLQFNLNLDSPSHPYSTPSAPSYFSSPLPSSPSPYRQTNDVYPHTFTPPRSQGEPIIETSPPLPGDRYKMNKIDSN